MKNHIIFIFLLGLFLISCINEPNYDSNDRVNKDSDNSVIVKTGKSFGFCVGYCSLEVTITSTNTQFVSSSWDQSNYPTKIENIKTDENNWNDILNHINIEEFEKLDDVIGCPDCADGGSEWIEIIYPDRSKKVTFEYLSDLDGMNELLEILRTIRDLYDESGNKQYIYYSNSFETENDTIGWRGVSTQMMVTEPAPNSGKKSLHIGGGCIQPAASLELNDLSSQAYYISFWAKVDDENQAGAITLSNGTNEEPLPITVSTTEWEKFEVGPILVKDNFPLKIDIIIGGFVPASMFFDNLQVYTKY